MEKHGLTCKSNVFSAIRPFWSIILNSNKKKWICNYFPEYSTEFLHDSPTNQFSFQRYEEIYSKMYGLHIFFFANRKPNFDTWNSVLPHVPLNFTRDGPPPSPQNSKMYFTWSVIYCNSQIQAKFLGTIECQKFKENLKQMLCMQNVCIWSWYPMSPRTDLGVAPLEMLSMVLQKDLMGLFKTLVRNCMLLFLFYVFWSGRVRLK